MRKQSKGINKDASSSKKANGISEENYVFLKFSDYMDFLQSVKNASIALSKVVSTNVDIKLMSMRLEAREELSQKLMDISVTKLNTLLHNRQSGADGLGKSMVKRSRSLDSHLQDSANGRMKRSRKR